MDLSLFASAFDSPNQSLRCWNCKFCETANRDLKLTKVCVFYIQFDTCRYLNSPTRRLSVYLSTVNLAKCSRYIYIYLFLWDCLCIFISIYIYKKSAIHDLPLSQSVNFDSTIILKFKFLKTKSTCKIELLKYKLLLSRYLSESYLYVQWDTKNHMCM